MTDRTATHHQDQTTASTTPEGRLWLERFALYDFDGDGNCVHFHASSDLGAALMGTEFGSSRRNPVLGEGQVLVRLFVDEEPMSIVTVDGPRGDEMDDVTTIDQAIEVLVAVRDEMRRVAR